MTTRKVHAATPNVSFAGILKDTGANHQGDIQSRTFITGHNLSLSSSFENVWDGPTDLRPLPGAAGVTLRLRSTSADDTFGGTGANVVRVNGIEPTTGVEIFEDVQMAGLALSDPLSVPMFRIQPSGVIAKGSGGGNAGVIEFVSSDESPDVVYESIPLSGDGSGAGGTSSAAYMVPAGFVIWIESASWSVAATDPQSAYVGLFKVLIPQVGYRSQTVPLQGGGARPIGLCYPSGTHFEILAKMNSGAGQEMSASFTGRLVIKVDGQCTG